MTLQRPDISGVDPDGAASRGSNVFGLAFSEEESNVILVPVPWDPTTSYRPGTARGWSVIRKASAQVDLLDIEMHATGLGEPWKLGIHMAEPDPRIEALNERARALARPIIEAGGVVDGPVELRERLASVNRLSDQLNELVYSDVARRLAAGKIVGLVGGEHSVSFGSIRAHAERWPGLGLLQVDAHADLRMAYDGFLHSHASIMCNVLTELEGVASITQVGIRDLCTEELAWIERDDRLRTFFEHALRARLFDGESWSSICRSVVETLPEHVYVSFDIDGLDPALCPSTGTPVPGGLSFAEATSLLRAVHASGRKVVGFDLTEVAPAAKGDEWDGNVGARLLYKLAALALLGHGA